MSRSAYEGLRDGMPNRVQILIGVFVLLCGVAVYLIDRPPRSDPVRCAAADLDERLQLRAQAPCGRLWQLPHLCACHVFLNDHGGPMFSIWITLRVDLRDLAIHRLDL